ncbi:NADH-quinone oxidoreductase subunit C [Calderihabitans maritimus]|uniref:NADH-quinone oxidoreductase subunit C n=1 Tax=Calderihabitans maritimus TaxID=1246530 RepID=A0A1Z5HU91_9FIRM|nr:NADH-quinone oxidoreductase subunit C [Calderihabitans maritimus]GAW92850.1 NADH (or F420H2) dehydrogenase subunit C [Calderihabitans maritimus]
MDNIKLLVDKLNKRFSGDVEVAEGDPVTLLVPVGHLVSVMKELKDDKEFGFNMLMDITAVDYPENFFVVYHLMSMEKGLLLRVKVKVGKEQPKVPSLVSLWSAADVQEREVYDLMGIKFEGHPNLKRILCPDDFEGHPLRKDYKAQARN